MKTSSGKGILRCRFCGKEIHESAEAVTDNDKFKYFHNHTNNRRCDASMPAIDPRVQRALPITEEDIIDRLLTKYE